MKSRLVILFLNIALILPAQSGDYNSSTSEDKHWVMVWSDEFNYEGFPDPDKWSYDLGNVGWVNDELTYYTRQNKKNVYVENGELIIRAQKEKLRGADYTSGCINTKYNGDWKYGRIEVRAKFSTGRGILHSIWMLPRDNLYGIWPASGEIDIMEHVGFDPGMIYSAIHNSAYNHVNHRNKSQWKYIESLHDNFHIYSVEWTPEKIDFLVDGEVYFTYEKKDKTAKVWPFDKEFYLLFSSSVGGVWAGIHGIDDSIIPSEMKIDWVRVYQYELKQQSYKIHKDTSFNGDVKYMPDNESYTQGQKVVVEAIPDDGYVFSRWEGSVQGNTNPLSFDIYRNMKIAPVFKKEGEILENSNFSLGRRNWILQLFNRSLASYKENLNEINVVIYNPGEKPWEIQLNQYDIPLEKGKKYRLSVNIKSDKRRWINFGISRNYPPFRPYVFQRVFIHKSMRSYSFDFRMRYDDDFHSRFFMDLGDSKYKVNIESISLREVN